MRHIAFLLFVLVIATGCSSKQQAVEVHEKETISKTVWTEKTELFMEYDEPKAGSKAGFLIHMTALRDFKPISEGSLTLTFTPETGEAVIVNIDKSERPGIFKTDVLFNQPGKYALKVALAGKTLSDEILLPHIEVAGNKDKHEEAHHEEKAGGDISFLKEQQWTVDFMVGLPIKQQVFSSFIAAGEVIPVANAEAVLSAPLSGTLSLTKQLPYPGKKVVKDEALAVIEPPVSQQGGMGSLTALHAEAKNRVVLAQKEYERAVRLYEAKAAPKRRVEEAELSLESSKAAFEPLDRAVQEMKPGSSGNRVVIKAPYSGTVVELFTANGRGIDAGQPVLRLINTSTVWLKANVPATELSSLRNIDKASFTIPGIEGELKPSRLVTVNDVVDPKTRTVPVIFEVKNSEGRLKVGMFADVSLRTGHAEDALTLPEEALFEDEGKFFVFVQKQGESFERREVKTGIRGSGHVQILAGLKEDERIVLKGGYYVKLASLSSRTPDAHAGHGH